MTFASKTRAIDEVVEACSRGIRTTAGTTRNTLDPSAVPVLQQVPVVDDPSRGTGTCGLAVRAAGAALAAAADRAL